MHGNSWREIKFSSTYTKEPKILCSHSGQHEDYRWFWPLPSANKEGELKESAPKLTYQGS
jgi:hypothetical protein